MWRRGLNLGKRERERGEVIVLVGGCQCDMFLSPGMLFVLALTNLVIVDGN